MRSWADYGTVWKTPSFASMCCPFQPGWGVLLLGGLLIFLTIPDQKVNLIHGLVGLSGLVIGVFTDRRARMDHRGTHGFFFLIVAWSAYLLLSRFMYPEIASVSEWFYNLMLDNLINAFILMGALYFGSLLTWEALPESLRRPAEPGSVAEGRTQKAILLSTQNQQPSVWSRRTVTSSDRKPLS